MYSILSQYPLQKALLYANYYQDISSIEPNSYQGLGTRMCLVAAITSAIAKFLYLSSCSIQNQIVAQ